jgi:hypothetical protein
MEIFNQHKKMQYISSEINRRRPFCRIRLPERGLMIFVVGGLKEKMNKNKIKSINTYNS